MNMLNPPTEMTYQDRLIIKDNCDKIIRCLLQFKEYTIKEIKDDDYLYDYEEYEDFKKSTTIPIYSYYNEEPMDGLCEVELNTPTDSYVGGKGSEISLLHNKEDELSKYNTGFIVPISRFTKTNCIYNAVNACCLYYSHFNPDTENEEYPMRGVIKDMLLEEYKKEPLFIKRRV